MNYLPHREEAGRGAEDHAAPYHRLPRPHQPARPRDLLQLHYFRGGGHRGLHPCLGDQAVGESDPNPQVLHCVQQKTSHASRLVDAQRGGDSRSGTVFQVCSRVTSKNESSRDIPSIPGQPREL